MKAVTFPAIAYLRPIRQWALTEGIPMVTWHQVRAAMARYEIFRAQLN
jgi:hypothetical protein